VCEIFTRSSPSYSFSGPRSRTHQAKPSWTSLSISSALHFLEYLSTRAVSNPLISFSNKHLLFFWDHPVQSASFFVFCLHSYNVNLLFAIHLIFVAYIIYPRELKSDSFHSDFRLLPVEFPPAFLSCDDICQRRISRWMHGTYVDSVKSELDTTSSQIRTEYNQ